MPEIYLVRHGESVANTERRFDSTPPGAPLTRKGLQQAQRVADWFLDQGIRPDLLMSSPYLRARQTAAPLRTRTNRPLVVTDFLRETNLGLWDGLQSWDFHDDPHYQRWRENPEIAPPGGGDRLSDVEARLRALLETLIRIAPGARLALFTHQHPLRAALSLCGKLRDETGALAALPNAAIMHLHYAKGTLRLLDVDRSIHRSTTDSAQRAI